MTEFNIQVNALEKGEDVSNVEFITVQISSVVPPSVVDTIARDDVDDASSRDDVTSLPSSSDLAVPSSNSEVAAPMSTGDSLPPTYPVHCFCWRDKKPVYFVNNVTSPWDVTTVVRKQKDGSNKTYPYPLAVDLYNKYMGGVDLADAMRKVYSCSRKSKGEWYMRLFWFLVDTSVVNAYILECESPNRPASTSRWTKDYQTQLKFTLELA